MSLASVNENSRFENESSPFRPVDNHWCIASYGKRRPEKFTVEGVTLAQYWMRGGGQRVSAWAVGAPVGAQEGFPTGGVGAHRSRCGAYRLGYSQSSP